MSNREIVLFEDDGAALFEPVALTRSVAQLRAGAWTHWERWARLFDDRDALLLCRGALAGVEEAADVWKGVNAPPRSGDVLFVAASIGRPEPGLLEAIRSLELGRAIVCRGVPVAARCDGVTAGRLFAAITDLVGGELLPASSCDDWPRFFEECALSVSERTEGIPRTLVDLMHGNAEAIEGDFAALASLPSSGEPGDYPGVHFVARERIRLSHGVRLDPGVVLDARAGPIFLGPRTWVMANAVLIGPVVLDVACLVKPGARLMDGVSLGPSSRIGGEVDRTIVLGYSNKQHDGFLGHSYLGSWVNLGAATDTSDLKNDYGVVRIQLAGRTVDTQSRHVGSLIGDHSKTAIHTSLNTGTVIGVSANVFGAGFPPKEIPSFTWGAGEHAVEYRLDKAVAVAKVVTERRGISLGTADQALLAAVFEATSARREALLQNWAITG
jgi:UDP-N-acetylglucosamine diphosphorylase/glucosamine-1-phosphate N-acetyltransferase